MLTRDELATVLKVSVRTVDRMVATGDLTTLELREGIVRFNGAIDDAPSGGAKVNYVEQALAALAAGRPVEPATTKPYGCSVKY